MKKNISNTQKLLSLLLLAVLLVGCIENGANKENKVEPDVPCGSPVYVKIGEHHLKLPGDQSIALHKIDGSLSRRNCWQSLPDQPIEVNRISLGLVFNIEGYEPLGFHTKIYFYERQFQSVVEILQDLEKRNIELESLPVQEGFYIYKSSNQLNRKFFRQLDLTSDNFLLVDLREYKGKKLGSSGAFNYADDLAISMSPIYDQRDLINSLSAWNQLHHLAVQKIRSFKYAPPHLEKREVP